MTQTFTSSQCLRILYGFCCCLLGTSIPFISGIIHVELLAEFGRSDVETVWAGSILNSMFALSGPIGSILTNTFSCRVCIIIGSILGLLGFGLSSLADDIYILYLTYGLMAGTGQSLTFTGTIVAIGYYFREKHSIALGLVVCGCAVGMLALPPIVHLSILWYGMHGTFRLLGAMAFQCAVFGALMKPNKYEIDRKLQRHDNPSGDTEDSTCSKAVQSISNTAKVLMAIPFLLFCLSTFAWNMSFNISYLYFPVYFKTKGVSMSDAGYLISATGIGNMCSRFLVGFATSDVMIPNRVLYFGQFSLIGLLTLLLPFYNNYSVYFVYMTLFGLYTGGVWVLASTITVELVGVLHLASAFGIVMLSAGLGQIAVPVLAGLVVSGSKELDLTKVFVISGVLFITSGILCAMTVLRSTSEYSAVPTQNKDNTLCNRIQMKDVFDTEICIQKK